MISGDNGENQEDTETDTEESAIEEDTEEEVIEDEEGEGREEKLMKRGRK